MPFSAVTFVFSHARNYQHVVIVRGIGVFLIGCDVDYVTQFDWNILVIHGIAGTNFRTLCIKGNSKRTSRLGLLGLASIIDDGLMILFLFGYFRGYSLKRKAGNKTTNLIAAMRKVHAHNI